MDQHVIHSIIATAHSVNLYQDALQVLDLIMKLAIASLLKCVQKIYVGMAQHVILTIIVNVLYVTQQ